MAHNSITGEDDAFLSFLDKDVLDSQTTIAAFDSAQFFEGLSTDGIKYQDLLHPPSPPTSVGTYSESSGSPQHSNVDSCDEGSGSDVPMEGNPLDYWQYVCSDLSQPANLSLFADQLQQHQQPGAWPIFPNVDAALLQPSTIPVFTNGAAVENINNNNANVSKASPVMASMPPSPASSVKTEKRTKRAKKQVSAPAQQAPLVPLVPLAPLKPLMPLAPLAPQPAPLSPPTSVHDVIIKQSPPLSPRILSPSQATAATAATGATSLRRPSIVPAPAPNVVRSNIVLVKSTLIPEEKPQSEAAMTAQAKRQERLIKNRAAALLSRKRKREHINLLETHTDLLKTTNQELKERVEELEDSVKTLTIERDAFREERDTARQECELLRRRIDVLTHRPQPDALRMDVDLERQIRSNESERGLNSKATGVVFMIILFSFALFNLPSGKLETLMVGGSLDRPRIGASGILGRALDSYTKNPTISGQVRESTANKQAIHNMTDLVVFSDNRALQTWLGHQPVTTPKSTSTEGSSAPSSAIEKEVINKNTPSAVIDENTKSVGFVAQRHEPLTWASPDAPQDMNEPDRDAWLYCSNLMYSLRSSSVSKAAGPAQATDGEFRRPRLSFISPLDGVVGSEKDHLPPWMPNSNSKESNPEQKYLRLDVEVTSSRVVSGKGLVDHEQLIRFPLMPVGVFDNMTTSLAPAKAAAATPVSVDNGSSSSSFEGRKHLRPVRSSRINGRGGVTKNRRIYDKRDQPTRGNQAASQTVCTEEPMPLASIKEEPMEIFIKEEPMD